MLQKVERALRGKPLPEVLGALDPIRAAVLNLESMIESMTSRCWQDMAHFLRRLLFHPRTFGSTGALLQELQELQIAACPWLSSPTASTPARRSGRHASPAAGSSSAAIPPPPPPTSAAEAAGLAAQRRSVAAAAAASAASAAASASAGAGADAAFAAAAARMAAQCKAGVGGSSAVPPASTTDGRGGSDSDSGSGESESAGAIAAARGPEAVRIGRGVNAAHPLKADVVEGVARKKAKAGEAAHRARRDEEKARDERKKAQRRDEARLGKEEAARRASASRRGDAAALAADEATAAAIAGAPRRQPGESVTARPEDRSDAESGGGSSEGEDASGSCSLGCDRSKFGSHVHFL